MHKSDSELPTNDKSYEISGGSNGTIWGLCVETAVRFPKLSERAYLFILPNTSTTNQFPHTNHHSVILHHPGFGAEKLQGIFIIEV